MVTYTVQNIWFLERKYLVDYTLAVDTEIANSPKYIPLQPFRLYGRYIDDTHENKIQEDTPLTLFHMSRDVIPRRHTQCQQQLITGKCKLLLKGIAITIEIA